MDSNTWDNGFRRAQRSNELDDIVTAEVVVEPRNRGRVFFGGAWTEDLTGTA